MRRNRSVPPAQVVPVLIYPDVRAAVAWLEAGLGCSERVRIGEDHRAQLAFGSAAVIVADVRHDRVAPSGGVATHSVLLRVDDVDALVARAREQGARVAMEPTDFEYGERQAELEDPFGHRWTLSQTLRDVEPEEWGGVTMNGGHDPPP
jgi:uncharacterized glyoxalase superfamily protein PhnB